MQKILIVDDNEEMQRALKRSLANDYVLLQSLTIEEARRLYQENADIALIVMDGCVPGDEINTLPLVREFRQNFSGPIIANSGNPDYQQQLLAAGCSHLPENKMFVIKLIKKLLSG